MERGGAEGQDGGGSIGGGCGRDGGGQFRDGGGGGSCGGRTAGFCRLSHFLLALAYDKEKCKIGLKGKAK